MNAECVVADANVAFKALAAGRGDLRDRIGASAAITFYEPRFLFVELFKHKERLAAAAEVSGGPLTESSGPAGMGVTIPQRGRRERRKWLLTQAGFNREICEIRERSGRMVEASSGLFAWLVCYAVLPS